MGVQQDQMIPQCESKSFVQLVRWELVLLLNYISWMFPTSRSAIFLFQITYEVPWSLGGGCSQTLDPSPSANAPSPSPLYLLCWRQISHAYILVGSPSLEWNTRRKKRKRGGWCWRPWSPCIKPTPAMSTITSSHFWKSTVASVKITFPSWKMFLNFCRVSLRQGQKWGERGRKVNGGQCVFVLMPAGWFSEGKGNFTALLCLPSSVHR